MTAAQYWKLKASLLEAALLEEQARSLQQRATFVRLQAFGAVGLPTDRQYTLDDTALRAIAEPPS